MNVGLGMFVNLNFCLSGYVSVWISGCPSVGLDVCLDVHISVQISVWLSGYLY